VAVAGGQAEVPGQQVALPHLHEELEGRHLHADLQGEAASAEAPVVQVQALDGLQPRLDGLCSAALEVPQAAQAHVVVRQLSPLDEAVEGGLQLRELPGGVGGLLHDPDVAQEVSSTSQMWRRRSSPRP
jgi:hypothetical protein